MSKNKRPEVRVRGVSEDVIRRLKNAADNYGLTLSQFLKPRLREIADTLPDKLTRDIVD